MATKQSVKTELQKLKSLSDKTDAWSRRVQKFWKSTAAISVAAAEATNAEPAVISQFQSTINDTAERVCTNVENVKDLAQIRYSELSRNLQEKGRSKVKDPCCTELHRRVGGASFEISTAIFSTFRTQADQVEQLMQSVLDFQRRQLEANATGRRNASCDASKKRDASSDENNVEVDWDAFDKELSMMSDMVDQMGKPTSDRDREQIRTLKDQLRQAQRDSGDLIKRALLAEHALESLEKRNAELKDQVDTVYNQDDVMEMRKALQKEQLARIDLEQRLRDAQEEIKAAQFAYKVAKAVANRIADTAEVHHQGGIMRSQSERQFPENLPIQISTSVQASPEASVVEETLPGPRTDSAFSGDRSDESPDPSSCINPFLAEEPIEKQPDSSAVDYSNPFLAKQTNEKQPEPSSAVDCANPFLTTPSIQNEPEPSDGYNPFLTMEASQSGTCNPFLTAPKCTSSNPFGEVTEDDVSSNPFRTSTLPTTVEKQSTPSDWNPFAATTTTSNPFLS